MKKILKISLVSMFVAMPMIAGAAPVAGEPVAGNADSPTATSTPKYALKGAGENDNNTATAGYVKGAYNAVIKGINNTQDEINTLNTGITTYRNAIGQLTTGKATQSGTVATIKSATTTESINDSTVNFTGVTPTSISATASGNVNLSVPVMADWENDSAAANPVQTTASFSGLAVNNLTMSAPTTNTAELTKTGINGAVTVAEYVTQAINAGTFDFTQLIDVDPDDTGYLSADGNDSYNADGLSNGEWTITWNQYGTAKGTTLCSETSGTYATSGNPSFASVGKNCWCQMIEFTDNNGTTYNQSSPWMPSTYPFSSFNHCMMDCAYYCSEEISSYNVRSAMFGSVQ